MTEAQARAAGLTEDQIAALHLSAGAHSNAEAGCCLLEAETLVHGLPFGDRDPSVDPVLAEFGRSWNDVPQTPEQRDELKRYLGKLAGTNHGPALSLERAFMALDWLWRSHVALAMEQVPELAEHAAQLRAMAPITAQLSEAERGAALEKAASAARDAWAARAARDAWAARAARAAWAAWDAWAARAARAAWAARDARDAWAAWAAAAAAFQTAAYEAAKGSATYEEARAKANAVFDKHRAAVREQLHNLYLRMINAELREISPQPAADHQEARDE